MSAGAWAAAIYFGVGWPMAVFLWVVYLLPEARRDKWTRGDWFWWIFPMFSVPGFILTIFWPVELIEWLTERGEGRHRA